MPKISKNMLDQLAYIRDANASLTGYIPSNGDGQTAECARIAAALRSRGLTAVDGKRLIVTETGLAELRSRGL